MNVLLFQILSVVVRRRSLDQIDNVLGSIGLLQLLNRHCKKLQKNVETSVLSIYVERRVPSEVPEESW